jgi:hypothetical protein
MKKKERKRPVRRSATGPGIKSAEKLKRLVDYAWELISAHRRVRIELGRTFLKIKAEQGHGRWKEFYARTFAGSHVSLRTAQRYMRMVREEESVKLSPSKSATDAGAINIRDATARAETEVAKRHTEISKLDIIVYKLSLRVTPDQADRISALQKSAHWEEIATRIITLLDRVFVDDKIINVTEPGS